VKGGSLIYGFGEYWAADESGDGLVFVPGA